MVLRYKIIWEKRNVLGSEESKIIFSNLEAGQAPGDRQ